jgi:hypothetical protein
MYGYEQPTSAEPTIGRASSLHPGVRSFMNGVYAWMAGGLALTAAVAWGLGSDINTVYLLFGSPLRWVVLLAPLAMAWFLPSKIPTMDRGLAVALFAVFAAVMGAALSYIPLMMASQPGVLVQALVTTIGVFAGMAVLGFVTKKDLTGMGQFLAMAVLGAVFASLVNVFFVQSAGLSMGVSVVVAIAAAGLTAYHTQALKQLYLTAGAGSNLAILGALQLYVDFINLFLSLLRLMSNRD